MAEPTASVTFDRQRHRVYIRMEMDEADWDATKESMYGQRLAPWSVVAAIADGEREKSDQSDIMDRFDPPDVEIRRGQ